MYLLVQWNEKVGGVQWSETEDQAIAKKHLAKKDTSFSWVFLRESGMNAKEIKLKDLE